MLAAFAVLGSAPALAQGADEAKAWEAATTCEGVKAYIAAYPNARTDEASERRAKLCKSGPTGETPTDAPATRGSGASVALPDGYEIVSNVLLPAESYLPESKTKKIAAGVVLLDRSQRVKNEKVCEAMLGGDTRTMRTHEEALRANPSGDYLVTHWLARAKVNDEKDCDELLAKYDFARSESIRAAYGLKASKGPLFIAFDPDKEIVFLDLADASPDEVFKATGDWMELALTTKQTGPNAGKPQKGVLVAANKMFEQMAMGFASLVGQGTPTALSFYDQTRATTRQFNVYKAGVYLIGMTFPLKT